MEHNRFGALPSLPRYAAMCRGCVTMPLQRDAIPDVKGANATRYGHHIHGAPLYLDSAQA
ncbi:MAG: hypothetical protein HC788_12345 [Sphingopyxis sp.]|nr:hypothetical protein [Sphingopyxis sp.]